MRVCKIPSYMQTILMLLKTLYVEVSCSFMYVYFAPL